jgi:sialate O-acetylesterase
LEKDEDLRSYLSDYQKATEGKSVEEQCKEYDEYVIANDSWQKKCEQLYKENPQIEWDEVQKRIGKCLWPGPMGCKNPYRPAGLYECMIERIVPYTLKGFLYYQGESDDHKPTHYYKLFRELIDQWRSDWKDDTLPFVFVQLPEHRYRQDKDFKNWPLIRDAQRKI